MRQLNLTFTEYINENGEPVKAVNGIQYEQEQYDVRYEPTNNLIDSLIEDMVPLHVMQRYAAYRG